MGTIAPPREHILHETCPMKSSPFACAWGLCRFALLCFAAVASVAAVATATTEAAEPPAKNPIAGLNLSDLGNQPLADLGFVDVTAAPFAADQTGRTDSTAALQRAILFAREHQMAVFFPVGEYLVSDTLECLHGRWDPLIGVLRGGRDYPCILVGDRSGPKRPRVRLAPRSPGFGDADCPKYVLHFWSRGNGKEMPLTEPQPNINMNQMLIGIDIEIGEGNPGAVAIKHQAAQGSSVQDCKIDARHGLTGLEGGAGSGGSHFNVTVIGGRIGVDYRFTQPAPTIVGFQLVDQTERAILSASRQALTVVGCRIASKTRGPVIETRQSLPHHGQISLVDCLIEFESPDETTAVAAAASITMHDVFVRNARTIVLVGSESALAGGDGWRHVRQFALGIRPPPTGKKSLMPGVRYQSSIFIDGRRTEKPLAEVVAGEPPRDLLEKHLWTADFPSWQLPTVANVKKPPYAARGDGQADDHSALQKAVDENTIVFLPKGIYAISQPLCLRADTVLLGVGRCFSWIVPRDGGAFDNFGKPQPLVQTADDARGRTALAFFGLRTNADHPGAFCLEWRCGRQSIFRDVNIDLQPWGKKKKPQEPIFHHPLVVIREHGGGKWYNFHQESWRWHGPNYRHLLIDGTEEPLHFYQCNPEHARGDANMEIRRAKYVSLYGIKGEYSQPIVAVRDSDHIRLFGYGGNASAAPGSALFAVSDTPNFLATNLVDSPRFPGDGAPEHFAGEGVDPRTWNMLIERRGDQEIRTEPLDRPVLYQRGAPRAP